MDTDVYRTLGLVQNTFQTSTEAIYSRKHPNLCKPLLTLWLGEKLTGHKKHRIEKEIIWTLLKFKTFFSKGIVYHKACGM